MNEPWLIYAGICCIVASFSSETGLGRGVFMLAGIFAVGAAFGG
jgi:hypothetical protein